MVGEGVSVGEEKLDVGKIREEFPILSQRVHGKPLIYLDSAATSQKPRSVLESMDTYYTSMNSNIHRGVHSLAERATEAFEEARTKVQKWINASSTREVIFVRGATEGINLVAQSYGRSNLKPDDEVLITTMEHHSNIVPWQLLCEQIGAKLKVIPINDAGEIEIDECAKSFSPKTRILALVHVSNALGTVNPVRKLVSMAHECGAVVLLDGAQAVPHMRVDVRSLDCDFYVFSGHKMFGPTGVGVLFGKEEHLEKMPPYQGGGEMIQSVTFEKTVYNDLPHKFEAGTPDIAGVVGLGAAIDFLDRVGMDRLGAYEADLLDYGTKVLSEVPGLSLVGTAKEKAGVLSFVLDGIHPHDIGTIVDSEGVAIRTGHHCAQPIMDRFKLPATARASLALYNTREELDGLVKALEKVIKVFN